MSLLDNLPHKATIRRRVRTEGSLGGSRDSFSIEQTNVACWEQEAGHNEILDFQKRGMRVTHKVYFTTAPGIFNRHQILITERNGTAVASPVPLDVRSKPLPDASVGKQILFKIMCDERTGRDD